ncbi:MAG: tRNA pseudouridine(13) synthase TruD [Campylobacterota bacterium]|nr:tRNA pseudouridine(13) synthase TruD [Campylobacterota bacterium]
MKKERIYFNTHKPLSFEFQQNKYDFIVEEIPLYKFLNKGNFFIMKIKKVYLSTWELIEIIGKKLNIDENQIGYAGLKDKNATTTQYISIPLNKSREFEILNDKNIKVLETFKHDKKLKIGDLAGNKFVIKLKNIKDEELHLIYRSISHLQKHGMANYFGYQRFGKDADFNYAKKIVYGEETINDRKLKNFLVSAYQSYFFNSWLINRVEISKQADSKKLIALEGDIFQDKERKIITGLMPGRKVPRAKGQAGELEAKYDDPFIHDKGFRRDAWVYPKDIQNRYNSKENTMQISFTLPKSSYATVFIENIANKNLGY